jgi:hypothetical protein
MIVCLTADFFRIRFAQAESYFIDARILPVPALSLPPLPPPPPTVQGSSPVLR